MVGRHPKRVIWEKEVHHESRNFLYRHYCRYQFNPRTVTASHICHHRIPHIIYSDAYASEMVSYADLVLPDTTYLERWDCISMLCFLTSQYHVLSNFNREVIVWKGAL